MERLSDRAHNWLRLLIILVLFAPTVIVPACFHLGGWLSKFLLIIGGFQVLSGVLIGARNHESEEMPDLSGKGLLKHCWLLIMHTDLWCGGLLGFLGTTVVAVGIVLS